MNRKRCLKVRQLKGHEPFDHIIIVLSVANYPKWFIVLHKYCNTFYAKVIIFVGFYILSRRTNTDFFVRRYLFYHANEAGWND